MQPVDKLNIFCWHEQVKHSLNEILQTQICHFFQVRLAITDKRDVTIFVVQLFYSDMTQTLHETSSSLTNY